MRPNHLHDGRVHAFNSQTLSERSVHDDVDPQNLHRVQRIRSPMQYIMHTVANGTILYYTYYIQTLVIMYSYSVFLKRYIYIHTYIHTYIQDVPYEVVDGHQR